MNLECKFGPYCKKKASGTCAYLHYEGTLDEASKRQVRFVSGSITLADRFVVRRDNDRIPKRQMQPQKARPSIQEACQKSLDQMLFEIEMVETKSQPCRFDTECARYDCFYFHTTKSGLSPSAEKLFQNSKKKIPDFTKKEESKGEQELVRSLLFQMQLSPPSSAPHYHQQPSFLLPFQAVGQPFQSAIYSVQPIIQRSEPVQTQAPASSSNRTLQISSHLSCSICLQQMSEPLTTVPCLHNFCKVCIEGWLSTQVSKKCPLCKQLVQECKKNVVIAGIIEEIKRAAK